MALGGINFEIESGGGQQRASSALVAKTVVQIGVSPGGDINTVYRFQSLSAAAETLGAGPLLEAIALRMRSGLVAYAVPASPSVDGVYSASVSQVGTGTGTISVSGAPHRLVEILCSTSGTLGTMKFRWRLDGSGTWSDPVSSTGPGTFYYRIPGTFCRLGFAAASYVATKTLTVGLDGTVTPGSGWVGTVTQDSSPIDQYEVVCTVTKAGALGTAGLRISLDNGVSTLPDMMIPTSGTVVIPGTGLVLTCANTFDEDDEYSFLALPPGFSTSDLDDALDALRADATVQAALVHVIDMPSSAANAISAASTLDTQIQAAFDDDGVDLQALCECPRICDRDGDFTSIVVSGGNAIRDTADDDDTIRAAREDQEFQRTAVCAGSHRMTSPVTGRKVLRPFGWALVSRFVDTEPREDLSALSPRGPLKIYQIGPDELEQANLDDVQINVARSYRGRNGAFLAITSGGFGFKNLTTDAAWQDAGGLRAVNQVLAALRVAAQEYLGKRPLTNADGTIEEKTRRAWSGALDAVAKKACGLLPGGDFVKPQLSAAEVQVLASSQLGQSPHRLDIEYDLQTLGFVSEVHGSGRFAGVLTVEA